METFSAVTNGESIFLLELANHAPDDLPVGKVHVPVKWIGRLAEMVG